MELEELLFDLYGMLRVVVLTVFKLEEATVNAEVLRRVVLTSIKKPETHAI